MSYQSELNFYIVQVQQRLRLGAWVRGIAIFAGTALVVTVALVLILNQLAFPAHGVNAGRLVILAALASAGLFGVALPLMHLTRARAVRRAESHNPELDQRLSTFLDRTARDNSPFLELLAADTLSRTRSADPASLVPDNRLFALGGGGFACLGVLIWMIAAGPGYLGYGASLLWTGPKKDALYSISVVPGNATVRRNSDQLITARISGMEPASANLFAHYQSAQAWEPVAMQKSSGESAGTTFQFVFAGLPESVEYYVKAGPLESSHFRIRVVDLPSVKDIRVTYHYPPWTGMSPVTEEHSGDLRAIEGTDAVVQIQTDRPLKNSQLEMDGGEVIHLTEASGNTYQGTISMKKDGAYHVATSDEGQQMRLSEDYFIATDKAAPPEISISRPGGDYRASPIEEVTVGLKAADQFGLRDMHLHYSVNGGPDRDVSLLKAPGAKSAENSHTLSLEDFKLVPGDLIAIYATAKDGHNEARTDMSFIQVDPFEREFSQSQQSAGGGGGAGSASQMDISRREKELIAATWKQQNDKTATPRDAEAQGEFLSEAQQKLRDQVNALSVRMQSRDISQANKEFNDFDKDMQDAAAAMTPAAGKLKSTQWKDAIPLEQKALQALLRAEATFRQIQVAFGQAGGNNGGRNAGRDLASLFDLELDTEKNQYETAQTASPAEQHQKDVQDALEKLDALARRQQDLANQQHNPQQNFQERWQQEMLRREAEQLQQQLEQMAQNGEQNSGQSSAQPGSSDQGGSQDKTGSQTTRRNGSSNSASNRSSQQQIAEALRQLRQATEAMRRGGNQGQNTEAARQAADQLRQASNLLAGAQQQLSSGRLDSLAREAERLRTQERSQADRISRFAAQQDSTNTDDLGAMMTQRADRNRLADERQQLSDAVSRLQKGLRDTARDMASDQPKTSQRLRDALTEMDDSDLDNRVQRSADWLRRGIDPNSNGSEQQIAQGLDRLSQQLAQAQREMNQEKAGQRAAPQSDQSAALDQLQRLREQIESMTSQFRGNGQGAQSQQQFNPGDRLSRNGQQTSDNGRNNADRAQASGQSAQNQQGQRGDFGPQYGGNLGNQDRGTLSGDIRFSGGVADGSAWNNINTGNNRYGPARSQPAPSNASGNPVDTERTFQQQMRSLNALQHMVQGDPQTAKEVEELTRRMRNLDPRRFPGNPEIVEHMRQEVLSAVDRLELQLERNGISSEARTGKPYTVPEGYTESVAEYYKRLSKTQ